MKKRISMILAVILAISLFVGCGKSAAPETTPSVPETTAPAVTGPASALELMETVWGAYADDQKFSVYGGGIADPVMDAPGNFDLADESISVSLMIPAEQLGNVTEAASLTHMLNSNTFTAGAFKLAEGVSAADFAAAMQDSIKNNQWICGFPEQLLIEDVAGQYVVVAFGAMDLMEVFAANLTAAYPTATEVVNEPLM